MWRIRREVGRLLDGMYVSNTIPLCDVIVVWAGICDITQKDSRGRISLRSESLDSCFSAMDQISAVCRTRGMRVMFATIAPASLYTANGCRRPIESYSEDQALLEHRVNSLNTRIFDVNVRNGERTPRLHTCIVRHGIVVKWSLLPDGVHFADKAKADIARSLRLFFSR